MISSTFQQSKVQLLQELREYYQKKNAFEKLIQHYITVKKQEMKTLYNLIKDRFATQELKVPYAIKRWIREY